MRRAMRIIRADRGVRTLRRTLLRALPALVVLWVLLGSAQANAYPFMVRHGYSGCAPCHLDPSGAGVLTPYGRTVGGLVLRTRYGEDPDEAKPADDFLFGAVSLPPELMLGADARGLWVQSKVEGVHTRHDTVLMQVDLEAAVAIHHVIASASIGYAEGGAFAAAITRALRTVGVPIVSGPGISGSGFLAAIMMLNTSRWSIPLKPSAKTETEKTAAVAFASHTRLSQWMAVNRLARKNRLIIRNTIKKNFTHDILTFSVLDISCCNSFWWASHLLWMKYW